MTPRENLIKAIRRASPQYVPHGINLCPSQQQRLKEITGKSDFMQYFDLPYRYVNLRQTTNQPDYAGYYESLPDNAYIDQWGVARLPSGNAHFTRMLHPMADFEQPEQVWQFPLPDLLADYRWEGYKEKVSETKENGFLSVSFSIQIFEYTWYLRGMENLLIDMMTYEQMAEACLNRITEIQKRVSRRLAECGIDMIIFGDDVASQRAMLMDPALWREWLKPGMRDVIQAAKEVNPDIIAYYHSDGDIYEIIPDLIEIGVDVLNPVQPECMDPIIVKEEFGDRLSFWGAVGTQTTMPFGTPDDIDDTVKHLIETMGRNGGFVIAPTHVIEPEVPWQNIMAFYNAVMKYRLY